MPYCLVLRTRNESHELRPSIHSSLSGVGSFPLDPHQLEGGGVHRPFGNYRDSIGR